jgi:hypothetical protein
MQKKKLLVSICVIMIFSIVAEGFIGQNIQILTSNSVYLFIRIITLSLSFRHFNSPCSHVVSCLFGYSILSSLFGGKSIPHIFLLVLIRKQLQGAGGRHV